MKKPSNQPQTPHRKHPARRPQNRLDVTLHTKICELNNNIVKAYTNSNHAV